MSGSNIPDIALDGKLAGESLVYSVDFGGDLDGQAISAHAVTVASGGATVEASDVSGTLVRARIGGGSGPEIRARYEATGADGRVIQCLVTIPIIPL